MLKRSRRALALLLILSAAARAQTPRNLLTGPTSEAQLAAMLVPADAWHPYPTIAERAAWDVVPQPVRDAYVREAEHTLGQPWGSIPATVTLRFVRDGNRAQYDDMNTARRLRLANLVMAEVFENRGRFLDEIANGIWAICEQTFWGSTAHLGQQRAGAGLPDAREPIVELFGAEAASLLAWTDYLLGAKLDSVSPRLRERIRDEVQRRELGPALARDDFSWMGFDGRKKPNNWNPWINSNLLETTLILERDPARRAHAVYKIMRSLDAFMNGYDDDGGCDEGPSYWGRAGGSLFENLELLHAATGGKVDLFAHPLVRNIGAYIYRTHVAGNWFVNQGDASARITPDAEIVYRFGRRIHDPIMEGFGVLLRQRAGAYRPDNATLGRALPALLAQRDLATAHGVDPLLGTVWLPDLQLMAARTEEGSARGLYLAAFGGHNGQSHNHNDVGNFIVYADGRPVIVDAGVETYTAKTFSPRRYEIWTMQSAYHNLPTINGVMQKDGAAFRADDVEFTSSANEASFTAELAKAYPSEAGVERWKRTVTLNRRASEVVLDESYMLRQVKEPVRLSLMTPLVVDLSSPGQLSLRDPETGSLYQVVFDAGQFSASTEEVPITDTRMRGVWGTHLNRVTLTGRRSATRGSYRLVVRARS